LENVEERLVVRSKEEAEAVAAVRAAVSRVVAAMAMAPVEGVAMVMEVREEGDTEVAMVAVEIEETVEIKETVDVMVDDVAARSATEASTAQMLDPLPTDVAGATCRPSPATGTPL
jgi:hypothetical protein